MSTQDEIIKTEQLLAQLKEKHAKEIATPKSKRILIPTNKGVSVLSDGNVTVYKTRPYNRDCVNNDNAFVNNESALLQSQRNNLVYKMRVAAVDSPVDWSDEGKNRKYYQYYPLWDFASNRCAINCSCTLRVSQLPHFASRERLDEFMDTLSADEQQLLICGVE